MDFAPHIGPNIDGLEEFTAPHTNGPTKRSFINAVRSDENDIAAKRAHQTV
jgi:hypothetical protein